MLDCIYITRWYTVPTISSYNHKRLTLRYPTLEAQHSRDEARHWTRSWIRLPLSQLISLRSVFILHTHFHSSGSSHYLRGYCTEFYIDFLSDLPALHVKPTVTSSISVGATCSSVESRSKYNVIYWRTFLIKSGNTDRGAGQTFNFLSQLWRPRGPLLLDLTWGVTCVLI